MSNYGGGAHTSDHLALRPDRIRSPLDVHVRRRARRHFHRLDRRLGSLLDHRDFTHLHAVHLGDGVVLAPAVDAARLHGDGYAIDATCLTDAGREQRRSRRRG